MARYLFVLFILICPSSVNSQVKTTSKDDCLGTWEIVSEFSDGVMSFPKREKLFIISDDSLVERERTAKNDEPIDYLLKWKDSGELVQIKMYSRFELVQKAQKDRHMYNAIMKVSGKNAIFRLSMDTHSMAKDFVYSERDNILSSIFVLRRHDEETKK